MRTSIVVAMLLLLISGYATRAGAADSGASQPCSGWYLGVLRYIFPLAIALERSSAVKNAGGNMTVTRP